MAGGADLVTAMENYGAPEEVAAAYLGAPVTTRTEVPSVGQAAPSSTEGAPAPPVTRPAGVQAGLAAVVSSSPASPSVWRQIFGVFIDARVYKSLLL